MDDDGVETGKTIKVTVNAKRLDTMWIEAELGINANTTKYLGAIGKIIEIKEYDDTVKVIWSNNDECWIPIKACITNSIIEEAHDSITEEVIEDVTSDEFKYYKKMMTMIFYTVCRLSTIRKKKRIIFAKNRIADIFGYC